MYIMSIKDMMPKKPKSNYSGERDWNIGCEGRNGRLDLESRNAGQYSDQKAAKAGMIERKPL